MTVAAPAAWPRLEDVVDPIRKIINGTDQISCLAHKDADADSLGSALGFALALRAMGHRVRVVVPEPLPRLLEHLPGFATVETGGAPLGVQHGVYGAINTVTGKVAWSIPILTSAPNSGVTVGGDLVFFGDSDGIFYAASAATGEILWVFDALTVPGAGGANAAPAVYEVNGVEYVVNAFGGSLDKYASSLATTIMTDRQAAQYFVQGRSSIHSSWRTLPNPPRTVRVLRCNQHVPAQTRSG